MKGRRAVLALAALLACAPSVARADDKARCISASEQGQQLRDEGRYVQARDAFATCAREACPSIVRRDCTRWAADLEQLWPTVVLAARDPSGRDLAAVRVELDGVPVTSSLDGKPTPVEPGQHLFHFEADGFTPAEQDVVVRAGEKDRVIQVTLRAGGAAGPSPRPRAGAPDRGPSHTEPAAGGPSTAGWAFAGLAIAAFGTEAYFGVTGLSDRSALLARPCARTATCAPGDVNAIRTKFAVADVALGVGVASAVLAAYFFLSGEPAAPQTRASVVDVVPVAGGATATMAVAF